ncbi:hypothetical protein DDE18_18090 [Nocardioides gansuensis]|uniref:DUF4430 domain-containing protein n=1 Tax=Nocardioides gansuensis TaxID=2138300 RepID=A0A2T8F6S6_9ACTN|nr:hypothetical protein DDE18_18090 [Nocardioides gansuensis]
MGAGPLALAWLLLAAALVGVPAAPAYAATCGAAGGVSVVVDFRELGGGLQTACAPAGGGRSAAAVVESVGHTLTYVQRQPGFVCRISGVPAADPCVNTPPSNAYWGLYWSDGTDGRWSYSSLGATSLTVPDGGSVAFAWQGAQSGAPAVPPPVRAQPEPSKTNTPSPTKTPTKTPTKSATPSPSPSQTQSPTAPPPAETSPSATATPTASASATRSPTPVPTRSRTPRRTAPASEEPTTTAPTATPTDDAGDPATDPGATAAEPASGSVPTWLVLSLLALLVAVAATVAVRARRRGSP